MKSTGSSALRDYVSLVKPGIVRGNMLAAMAGFFLASRTGIAWSALIGLTFGLSCIIAAACVFNNILDRHIDQKMERTRSRPLAAGRIRVRNAAVFGTLVLLIGSASLILLTNSLALILALFGLLAYVIVYGIGKRMTAQGTLIGSVSGAMPPVVGYVAAGAPIDRPALALFLILSFWQMPHFYGIALYRLKDYKQAAIPVLPSVMGLRATQIQVLLYIFLYVLSTVLLWAWGAAGLVYLVFSLALGLWWLARSSVTVLRQEPARWGRGVFLSSLPVLVGQCVLIALAPRLP